MTNRPIWILIPLALAILPFSTPLRTGALAGAGPDVINTVWAMWWFQQEWSGAAWGGHSTYFNFPFGGTGAILSPLSAVIWSLFDGIVGPARATTYCNLTILWLMMLAMYFVVRRLGLSSLAAGSASLLLVLPRYTIFTLGETGVVGVAILPILVGIYSLISMIQQKNTRLWGVVFALSMALQGLENPYLAFVLPLMGGGVLLWTKDKRAVLLSLLGGVACMGIVGAIHHGASAAHYESIRPFGFTSVFGLHFPVIERPWARASVSAMLWPQQLIWPYGSMDSIHIQGREFLGWSGVLLSVLALCIQRRKVLPWLGLSILGVVFVTGSDWGGVPSPFALFNSICAQIVRSLTQPSRYFLLFSIGTGVSVAYAVEWLSTKKQYLALGAWGVLLVESLSIGGLSLKIPITEVPSTECTTEVNWDGGILVWPWDGADDKLFEATLKSRLFQLVHEQPGATIGTGSWPLVGQVFPGHVLREIGWRDAMEGKGSLQLQQLADWGYTHVIVDRTVGRILARRARDEVFGSKNQVESCSSVDIYSLPEKREDAGVPQHPKQDFQPILEN